MHGVDEEMDRRIRELARSETKSINRTVQSLLRKALGLDVSGAGHRADFQAFSGRWSPDDLAEFETATAAFSKVDKEDWS
jgi:hypothetical protein